MACVSKVLGWGEEVDDEVDIPANIGKHQEQYDQDEQDAEDDNDSPPAAIALETLALLLLVLVVMFQHSNSASRGGYNSVKYITV